MRLLLPLLIACNPSPPRPDLYGTGATSETQAPGPQDPQPWPTVTTDGGTIPYVMSGFSFVDESVAGMPEPGRWVDLSDDLTFMQDEGIGLLVTLTEAPLDPTPLAVAGMDSLHIPIQDFHAPTLDQQRLFVGEVRERMRDDEKVGVHCLAGLGRTGTMLATWFVSGGMDAETAIAEVRLHRPGSIESAEQEDAVRAFEAFMNTEF